MQERGPCEVGGRMAVEYAVAVTAVAVVGLAAAAADERKSFR